MAIKVISYFSNKKYIKRKKTIRRQILLFMVMICGKIIHVFNYVIRCVCVWEVMKQHQQQQQQTQFFFDIEIN